MSGQAELEREQRTTLEDAARAKGYGVVRRKRGLCLIVYGNTLRFRGSQNQCFTWLRSLRRKAKT